MLSDSLAISFSNVRQAICRFADSASLCCVLRLHYFQADNSVVRFMMEDGSVSGLLGADDGRDSYDLNEKENKSLQMNSFFAKDNMKYFKTDLRLEKASCILSDQLLTVGDTAVVFTHEWAWLPQSAREWSRQLIYEHRWPSNWLNRWKLKYSVKWFYDHGYAFSFLE